MPVEILIVGGGSIGERHLRCFQEIGCDVALCEPAEARRHELIERYHLRRSFAAIEDAAIAAAARDPWHGIVICTPAHLHASHAAALAAATSALLIEKPLCVELADVEKLRLATADKVVQVAYVLRHHPAVQRVRAMLADGEIGPLHQVTVVAGQHFPSFRSAYRDIYYARRETGGGAVQDAATHLFDLIQHLAGPLDWLFCDYAHQELPGVEVEDTVHLLGRTKERGGKSVLVSLALNQFMAPNETHVQLNGAKGSLALRLHEQKAGLLLHGDNDWTWTEPLITGRDDLFRAQAESFLAAATGQHPPLCTLDDGARALRVNLAALESGATSRRQEIASPRQ